MSEQRIADKRIVASNVDFINKFKDAFLNYQEYLDTLNSESREQQNLIKWARNDKRIGNLLFALPNAGKRTVREATKIKREGLLTGVPDLFLAIPNKKYHGYFIELKTKSGKLTPQQKECIIMLNEQGYLAECVYGALHAQMRIENYLKEL